MKPGERLQLQCHDVDEDGAGLCEFAVADASAGALASVGGGKRAVHVAGSLPGETVRATITHVSSHHAAAWARLDALVLPSPARRPPDCAAFGSCGGCVLQHWEYDAQRAWKTARVSAIMRAVVAAPVSVAPCVASPRTLGYRNNAKLVAARGEGGALLLGGYAPRSHDVVDLRGCRIVEPAVAEVSNSLREVLEAAGVSAFDERRLTGDLRYAVLRANDAGQVLTTLVTARRRWDAGPAVAEALRARSPAVAGVVHNVNGTRGNVIFGDEEETLAGAPALTESLGGVRLRLSSRAFFQANRGVATLIYGAIADAVSGLVQPRDGRRPHVVDVYCGVGGITLTLAPLASAVVGIETNAAAVADAAAAARASDIGNARFVAGDAALALREVAQADVVVLNPPRRGCSPSVLTEVARLSPRLIAYLSCDPDTLARDLAQLVAAGFVVRSVTPYDMLPHTPHVEALALVHRPSSPTRRARGDRHT